jgi:hypothetical protein
VAGDSHTVFINKLEKTMFKKIKLYLDYFKFCWKAKNLIFELDFFVKLSADEGKRYNMEIKNLDRKIKARKKAGTLTKSLYFRSLLYESFNSQEDEEFSEELMFPFAMLAVWAITKEKDIKEEMSISEIEAEQE